MRGFILTGLSTTLRFPTIDYIQLFIKVNVQTVPVDISLLVFHKIAVSLADEASCISLHERKVRGIDVQNMSLTILDLCSCSIR